MKLIAYSLVVMAITFMPAVSSASPNEAAGAVATAWRSFISRSGWSIKYLATWHVSSCASCRDPHAPGVFVDFSPSSSTATGVMVEPLADKPVGQSVTQWLEDVKSGANLNAIVAERSVLSDGLTGLQVRYKNTSTDMEMESTYFIADSKTYAVDLFTDVKGKKLEDLSSYALYKYMVKSFKVKDVR